jgi:hypothetical protein
MRHTMCLSITRKESDGSSLADSSFRVRVDGFSLLGSIHRSTAASAETPLNPSNDRRDVPAARDCSVDQVYLGRVSQCESS